MKTIKLFFSIACLISMGMQVEAQSEMSFDKVRLSGLARVILIQGEKSSVSLEDNTRNVEEMYQITNDGWINVTGNSSDELIITMPELRQIDINGAGKLEGGSEFRTGEVEFKVSGAGKMEMNIQATKLKAVISGAGKIELQGNADEAQLEITGAGKIDAEQLKVNRCVANISGSGKCLINVTDELVSNISGSGSVYYVTKPQKLTNNITGPGKVGDAGVSEKDTTKIQWGKKKILIIDGEGRNVRVGFKDSTINIEDDKVKGHWAGFELGSNMLMYDGFSTDAPAGYDFLDLKTEKSISVNFNLVDYEINLYRKNIMLITGLGFSYNNFRFKSDKYLAEDSETLTAINDSTSYKKNKLVISYLNVPLLLEFNTSENPKKTFHISTGVIGGLRIGSHLKLVKESGSANVKSKSYDDFNINPFRCDATVRLGYRNFTVFANYGLLSLFKDDKGPEAMPFTVGLRIVGW
jgi:hypothetical protein